MRVFIFCALGLLIPWNLTAQTIHVGAKHFNEGYILSELIAQLLEHDGFAVARHYNLGGTTVCFEALRNGEIDVYPEYSGTLSAEILKNNQLSYSEIKNLLEEKYNLSITQPYGFNNAYALVIKNSLRQKKNITRISDLQNQRDLVIGLSYEFLKRQDGWDPLARHYQLPQVPVGLEHGLAYQALQEGKIDVTDSYSTDGEIVRDQLVTLLDDGRFFPSYQATSLYSTKLPAKAIVSFQQLTGMISESEMQAMNAAVLFEKKTFAEVAHAFLLTKGITSATAFQQESVITDLVRKTGTHLFLTFVALFMAVGLALPLGIILYWNPKWSSTVVYLCGLLQTIPSIALLAMMIPFFGIGTWPAIIALFLYALLPILRNTIVGLQGVDRLLKEVAEGMGMNRYQKLRWVELPLAFSTLLAGVRTAAVINVGTATLAAFIGAGGLGEYIVTGLALNNTSLILRGAIPAAALALLVEFLFSGIEKRIVPEHLRK